MTSVVVQRVLDRFWGLNVDPESARRALRRLLLFSASFLISTAFFRSMGGASEQANTPSKQRAAAGSHDTGSANPERNAAQCRL